MAIFTENDKSFFLSTPAVLFNDDIDIASDWAGQHIVTNSQIKWVLAKYVEADNANSNGQYWSLGDLQNSQSTIRHSPMNLGHRGKEIVGTWTAAEMIYPTESASAFNPYIETLGAFWKYYFPETLTEMESAYETGTLYVSMECRGDTITCGGENGCGETFAYRGPMDASYCEHVTNRESYRQINNPHFLAGALILPPERPGWANADVKDLSAKTTQDEMMQMIASESPELDAAEWERIMSGIQLHTYFDGLNERAKEFGQNRKDETDKTPASLIGQRIASEFMARSYQ